MKIISAPYTIRSTRSITAAPSSITADGEPARSVQPVFPAPASDSKARYLSQDVITNPTPRLNRPVATTQIPQITNSRPAVTNTASALDAYRQAEMLRLRHVETNSIIL